MKKFALVVLALCALWLAPARAQQTGPIYCSQAQTQNGLTTITQVVPAPGVGQGRTLICGYTVSAAAASAITFQYGTGTNCGTGTTTFGPTIQLGATSTFGELDIFHGLETPPGQAVCATGSTAASVTIYYVQQ